MDKHWEAGQEAGKAQGSWVLDGNTTAETARKILAGWEEGDPEIMDLQPSPLSGEMAGESMVELLGEGFTEEDADEYELGYSDGFWNTVLDAARIYA